MEAERASGWNLAHTYYQFDTPYVAAADSAGYRVLANLPGEGGALPDEEFIARIRALAGFEAVGWWDFPEERRYWVPEEMGLVENLAAWTREYDPARRPRYMYLPGHYRAGDIAHYVPYLDILPASVYPAYNDQPHAWARWRIEETIAAIEGAGATIGPDYLAGEKTVVAVVELLDNSAGRTQTPEGTYHDFWLSVACGARGVLVSSYAYRNASPALAASWGRLQEAAAQISGPEGVGSAFLFGAEIPIVSSRVIDGPARTPSFESARGAGDVVSYPSVMVAARRYGDDLYVIAVNSAEVAVTAELAGLPISLTEAILPFEERAVAVDGGRLAMSFAPFGVHVLIMRSAFQDAPAVPSGSGALVLEAAHPNPFRSAGRTVLQFVVLTEGPVRATLHDLLGRRVATLLEETLQAGGHRLDIDPVGLSTGSYIVRVEGQGSVASRRITLID